MLKKRAKGVQKDSICEKCGKEVKVLYELNGKKVCKSCLESKDK